MCGPRFQCEKCNSAFALNPKVACAIDSGLNTEVIVCTGAKDLLERLEKAGHIGNSSHPNKAELEAHKVLLRHTVRYGNEFQIHDDQWNRTCFAVLQLFDEQKAMLHTGGVHYSFADLMKEEWQESEPSGSWGGILYREMAGNVVLKRQTWLT
jgi:hypothetical protein